MQKTIMYYNENEVIESKVTSKDIKNGHNIWIDIVNPTSSEILELKKTFNLENKAVEKMEHKTKKPQVLKFDNQKFTVFLSLKFNTIKNLETYAIYFFVGNGWLITIHTEEIDLVTKGRIMFSEGKRVLESSVDGLYYIFLSEMIETYEQILTAIELKVVDVEKSAQNRPSKTVLRNLDLLSKQVITLRRHFWHARHVINYHNYMEEDKEDLKYLKIVYDDINQLIEMIQSYQDTINSTRDTFSNSISLQTNDVMRILTIFSTIILPLSLLISIISLQGFDLNNVTTIPKYFYFVIMAMILIIAISLFIFWKKGWVFSRDIKVSDEAL